MHIQLSHVASAHVMMVPYLVLITDSIAFDPHAQELAAAAIPYLRNAVLAPAVVAKRMPTVHGGCPAHVHFTEAALALQHV